MSMNNFKSKTLMYAPNEFTDMRDPLGIFEEEDLPITSFMTRYGSPIIDELRTIAVKYTPNSINQLPGAQLRMTLAPERFNF